MADKKETLDFLVSAAKQRFLLTPCKSTKFTLLGRLSIIRTLVLQMVLRPSTAWAAMISPEEDLEIVLLVANVCPLLQCPSTMLSAWFWWRIFVRLILCLLKRLQSSSETGFLLRYPQRTAVSMSKKRGLSLEEKREKMLQIFYESQDFFLLKELEKLGPKKGVITQSVKDVVQSLVDDDLVLKDKIGTSVYFWSLPSTAGNQLRNAYQKLESELQSSQKRFAELVYQCNELKRGREESDEREDALGELTALELKYKELKEEMGQFADNDPAAFESMKKAIEVAHASANRWTDNIFTLRQWCSNNFPQAKEQLENLYTEVGITDDFDYLELAPAVPLSIVGDQMLENNT
ncbi:meiotic nuclear division protein 1 isoform X2 [Tripterygium wilfordii]|uniref:Meiotic nuclear division protein 1 isoform X2 n=2 Tax=Tripterygium wilfordii TaxID=458696 RepID=A0A7J7DQC1_TRIWF|nr:meiotic nuclear division protein 1 isoform X2 [Tripterygium wilfordii]